jgi:hypothetical protein
LGVSASNHFIGTSQRNFSHFLKKPSGACLSCFSAYCPASLHSLSRSAPVSAPLRCIILPLNNAAEMDKLPLARRNGPAEMDRL